MNMLETAAPENLPFISSDALDECVVPSQTSQFAKPNPQESRGTRIFAARTQHVQDEIGKDYLGRVISICIVSRRGGILKYVHMRLDVYTPRCDR